MDGATVVIVLVANVCVLVYFYLTNNFNYWKKRNIKSLPAYPVVGSYAKTILGKKHVSLLLNEYYKQHPNEKVLGGFKGRTPELIVRDLDIIKMILIKDFHSFENRGFNNDEEREPLTKHLFLAKDDLWRSLRHKLTPTFTSGKMKKMFPLIAECGEELQKYIQKIVDDGKEPEIRDVMSKYTTDVIGSCAFGIQMRTLQEENSPFRLMGQKIFSTSSKQSLKMLGLLTAPRLFYGLGFKFFEKDVEDFFFGLFKAISENRKTEPTRYDFIDLLMELKTKSSNHNEINGNVQSDTIELTDELLAAQAFVFFAAGFETSSTTMSYCLHELSLNPKVQMKLANEITSVLQRHGGEITYDAVQEMKYLEMVICETLRKHPPGAWLLRKCTKSYTIADLNVNIDKDILVAIPVYALHHDPKYYPDPEIFDPERFSPETINNRHPMAYLPFGDGPRNCIGMRFGKLETAVGLISVLRYYSVQPTSKTATEIEYATRGLILTSKNGIWVKLKAR